MYTTSVDKRVVGASIAGTLIVFGAVLLSHTSSPAQSPSAVAAARQTISTTIPDRAYIPVTDTNNDGVEDWREEFVFEAPLIVAPVGSTSQVTFEMPTTVTDQVGLQVFEDMLKDKAGVQFSLSAEDSITRTTDRVAALAQDTLYTTNDIVTTTTDPLTIRRYGNAMGQSLIVHNVVGSEGELEIVSQALNTDDLSQLADLVPLADMYRKLRDDALNTPVPDRFATDHLNLINAYHTMYRNISEFGKVFDDPLVALLRIKRYQEDATALAIILNTMYRNALPYASLFTEDDPATVFIAFSN